MHYPNKTNWNFSLEETDEPLTEREQKNIETFKRNIQNGSSRLDISQNKAYKESGLNCDRIIVRKSVMEEAEKLGIDTDKIPYELLRPTAIPKENRYIKQIRILTSLKGKQDKQVCFQGNIDKNNLVVLDDILGYRQEAINALLEEEMRYINKKKARLLVRGGSQEPTHIDKPNELSERDRLLRNHANYTGDQTDAIVQPNEPSEMDRHLRERHLKTGASVRPDEPPFKNVASEYSRPSQAIYSENLEKAMDTADKAFEGKKDKVVNSLRNMGVEVTEDKRSDTKSQYIDVHLDNGSTIYVRVSNHPAKTRIDVSIEKDWKAGTRFIYDQVEKNDWGTKNNPYWQGDARLKFSLSDEEIDEKHASLYERYKNGDQAAYQDAAELVAEEARRKGYEVKVYHGTGSDGFNVAKADSSEVQNGEGSQAHGQGLYVATTKRVAEGYADRGHNVWYAQLNGRELYYKDFGFGDRQKFLDEILLLQGKYKEKTLREAIDGIKASIPSVRSLVERIKNGQEEHFSDADAAFFENLIKEDERDLKTLEVFAKVLNARTKLKSIKFKRSQGSVFDWFANLNEGNTIDEQKRFSEQNLDVQKKLREFSQKHPDFKNLARAIEENVEGRDIVWALDDDNEGYNKLLADIGIKGATYVGRRDGRCYVSFEGGATVKLQDPFTFNDNGELIPLSKRFDHTNPDMRFSLTDDEKQEKAREKAYKQKKARELITSKAGRALQAAVDMFAPLATLERVAYGKVRDAAQSAWKMALMTRNLDQVMFHVLRVGGIQYNKATGSFTTRKNTKGLEAILNPVKGKNYKNFENYAKAKSAFERWARLRKANPFAKLQFFDVFGFTIDEAKQWIKDGNEASKTAFQEIQEFFKGQRDFMLETGLISEKQHAKLSEFKNYVPFFREGKDLEKEAEEFYERYSEMFPGGKGFSGRNSVVKKFVGSKRKTKNLVENIVNQTRKVIDMLASAAILYSLYANQSRDEDDEKWYEKLPAHDKLNYWHFYMGNNTILRIPKPFELGYIFATIPEALTDQLTQRRPQTAKVLWQGFTSQLEFAPMANPVLDTIREQISNKDSFSGRPIVQQLQSH